MSLINKMLQDLDQRGAADTAHLPPDIRAAALAERRVPRRQVVIGASALTLCAAVAAFIWIKRPVTAVPPAVGAAPVLAPVVVPPPAPAAAGASTQDAPQAGHPVTDTPAAAPLAAAPAVKVPDAAVAAAAAATSPVFGTASPAAARPSAAGKPRMAPVPAGLPAPAQPMAARDLPAPAAGRQQTVGQRAENFYRQALASLDEGRVSAAYTAFDQALALNPRHDAARQSLVSLLIEDGRGDEAMQQLQQGLAADPGQTALAMLLARMQIERGTSGVETLLRTLPAATGNADYHAFLAGALQRDGRHKEAVDQYAAALRVTPEQGVWLMGMGISLQADKRDRDAAEAFRRAKASGMLTPALDAFVERKLLQLAQ